MFVAKKEKYTKKLMTCNLKQNSVVSYSAVFHENY